MQTQQRFRYNETWFLAESRPKITAHFRVFCRCSEGKRVTGCGCTISAEPMFLIISLSENLHECRKGRVVRVNGCCVNTGFRSLVAIIKKTIMQIHPEQKTFESPLNAFPVLSLRKCAVPHFPFSFRYQHTGGQPQCPQL